MLAGTFKKFVVLVPVAGAVGFDNAAIAIEHEAGLVRFAVRHRAGEYEVAAVIDGDGGDSDGIAARKRVAFSSRSLAKRNADIGKGSRLSSRTR